jgi:hypothetical protein
MGAAMVQGWLLGFLFGFCSNFCFASPWMKSTAYTVGEIYVCLFFCVNGFAYWKRMPIWVAVHPAWIRYGCWLAGVVWGIGHTAFPPSSSKGRLVVGVQTSWLYPAALVQTEEKIYMARAVASDSPEAGSYWGQTPPSSWWPVHMNATIYTQMFGLSALGARLRAWFVHWVVHRLHPLPLAEQNWLRGLFLGEMQQLSTEVKSWFKQLGIFHIVVISGFHISFLGTTLQRIAALFLRLAYGLLLISSPWYLRGMRWAKWVTLGLVFLFSFCIGFTPPVRAFLSYGYRQWCGSASPRMPLGRFLLHVAALQVFLFPTSFLTVSTLMSWVSYTTVLVSCRETSLWKVIKSYVFLQTGPLLFAGIFFQSLCFLSFFANLLFVPMFSGVFLGGFALLLLPPQASGYQVARVVQQVYLTGVEKFAGLLERYPFLYVDVAPLSPGYKRGIFFLSLCFLVALVHRVRSVSLAPGCKPK